MRIVTVLSRVSVLRQVRTLRSVGTGGGRLPPATREDQVTGIPTASFHLNLSASIESSLPSMVARSTLA